MVLHESEDITLRKLNTYKFDSRLTVTIILDEANDNLDTTNAENCNSPPPYDGVRIITATNNTRNKCSEYSSAVNNNQENYLLYYLSKNLITILVKYYSMIDGKCDLSDFLSLKKDMFSKSEKIVVKIILPRHSDHIFMQRFFNDTKIFAKIQNCSISVIEIKTLLCEIINCLIQKIGNDHIENNNKYPVLAERLKCVSNFFSKPDINAECQKTTGKRKSNNQNETKNNATKRKKSTGEEQVSSTSNESLINEIFSYTQSYRESISRNNGYETTPYPSNEKALSAVLLVNHKEKTQPGPGDILCSTFSTEQRPYDPINILQRPTSYCNICTNATNKQNNKIKFSFKELF